MRNAEDVHDVVDPLPPGRRPRVRVLPTEAEITALFDYLTDNGVPAPSSTYLGTERLLEDGTAHLAENGEQPKPAPAPASGFWDAVGGIAIGFVGGIAWVGEKAAYPFR